jgi:Muramidase (flagellum-specific)
MRRRTRSLASFFLSVLLLLLFSASSYAATAEAFYKEARKHKGIHPFAATCQSAHETGNWTSELWRRANNGAGIKADKKWIAAGRPTYKRTSKEHVNGKVVKRTSHFRAYRSTQAFLVDYAAKIKQDYPLSAKHTDTMFGYFACLRKGRYGAWATSGKYFEHLTNKAIALGPKLLGPKWKEQLQKEYRIAQSRKLLSKSEIAVVRKKFKEANISLK